MNGARSPADLISTVARIERSDIRDRRSRMSLPPNAGHSGYHDEQTNGVPAASHQERSSAKPCASENACYESVLGRSVDCHFTAVVETFQGVVFSQELGRLPKRLNKPMKEIARSVGHRQLYPKMRIS